MSSFKTLLGGRCHLIQISIPDNTGIPVNLYTLLKNAGIVNPIYVELDMFLADGTTQRPAIQMATPRPGTDVLVGTDFSTHGRIRGIGELIKFPPTTNFDSIFIRSNTGSTILGQFLAIEGI
jgi:hypothetical protein